MPCGEVISNRMRVSSQVEPDYAPSLFRTFLYCMSSWPKRLRERVALPLFDMSRDNEDSLGVACMAIPIERHLSYILQSVISVLPVNRADSNLRYSLDGVIVCVRCIA